MGKRILVSSASVGAGHLRAAEAVEKAIRLIDPSAEVENVDVLTLTNALFRRVYGKAYLDLVNRAPHLLGYFYDMTDRAPNPKRGRDKFRMLVERVNMLPLLTLIRDGAWDVVINTHFLPAELIARMRRKKQLDVPQATVVTDFDAHGLWVNQPCEQFFAATDEAAQTLESWGVAPQIITVTGIPIHPVFAHRKSPQECRLSRGLDGGKPVLLVLAGGFGVGPIERIFEQVLSITSGVEVVVVCGRNEKLKKRLEGVDVPARHRATIVGFTTEMDEWMAAADIIVSKPGGLTTSEALARGAAMAIVNPIPGQESRNSDYLLERGAAIKINTIATLGRKVQALIADGTRLTRLRENAARLGRPRAAYDVARWALGDG